MKALFVVFGFVVSLIAPSVGEAALMTQMMSMVRAEFKAGTYLHRSEFLPGQRWDCTSYVGNLESRFALVFRRLSEGLIENIAHDQFWVRRLHSREQGWGATVLNRDIVFRKGRHSDLLFEVSSSSGEGFFVYKRGIDSRGNQGALLRVEVPPAGGIFPHIMEYGVCVNSQQLADTAERSNSALQEFTENSALSSGVILRDTVFPFEE